MAPEIKRGEIYKGKEADIFSIGVIVFILVMGLFPFHEARGDNYYYNLLLNGHLEKYWQKVCANSTNVSPQFKNFIVKFFTPRGGQRITLDQIKSDPWFLKQSSLSDNEIRRNIISTFEANGGRKNAFKIVEQQDPQEMDFVIPLDILKLISSES